MLSAASEAAAAAASPPFQRHRQEEESVSSPPSQRRCQRERSGSFAPPPVTTPSQEEGKRVLCSPPDFSVGRLSPSAVTTAATRRPRQRCFPRHRRGGRVVFGQHEFSAGESTLAAAMPRRPRWRRPPRHRHSNCGSGVAGQTPAEKARCPWSGACVAMRDTVCGPCCACVFD